MQETPLHCALAALSPAALLACWGCAAGEPSDDAGAAVLHDSADDEGECDCGSFSASWSPSGVTVHAPEGGWAGSFRLGMAESDPDDRSPWTGEDCLDGYTDDDGAIYQFCHPMHGSGGALATVSSIDEIVPGETTLFSEAMENAITYAVWLDADGSCLTWGADLTAFERAGCAPI